MFKSELSKLDEHSVHVAFAKWQYTVHEANMAASIGGD